MSDTRALAVVGFEQPDAWRAALEAAVRAEFLVSPLILPAGTPLVPVCGVEGCRRLAELAAWGRFDTRLCTTHARRWKKAGRPPKDEWLPTQPRGSSFGTTERCKVVGCPRSAAGGEGLCFSHRREWRRAGTPVLSAFASSAAPAPAENAVCRIAGCGFPAWTGRARTGLCDAHAVRYRRWRSFVRRQPGEPDPSPERYIARISRRDEGAGVNLTLPAGPLLALELRFVLQHRHDAGGGLIHPRDWGRFVERLNALGVLSLLDREIESWCGEWTEPGHLPAWASYARYAWQTALEFRIGCGLADPWEPDVWRVRSLPIDQAAKLGHLSTLDWRPIEPSWLRGLCKRWARHQLRQGRSSSHVASVRRAILALVEFCGLAGWPLDRPACLTRELFDAFLDHVRGLERGAPAKISRAVGVKQLFEQAHDLGWISLHTPRVYLRGELPSTGDPLPRALPPAVAKRLNEPAALERLEADERAAMLVLMDCGLRATDTAMSGGSRSGMPARLLLLCLLLRSSWLTNLHPASSADEIRSAETPRLERHMTAPACTPQVSARAADAAPWRRRSGAALQGPFRHAAPLSGRPLRLVRPGT